MRAPGPTAQVQTAVNISSADDIFSTDPRSAVFTVSAPNDTLTLQGRRLFLPGGPQDSMRSIGPPSIWALGHFVNQSNGVPGLINTAVIERSTQEPPFRFVNALSDAGQKISKIKLAAGKALASTRLCSALV